MRAKLAVRGHHLVDPRLRQDHRLWPQPPFSPLLEPMQTVERPKEVSRISKERGSKLKRTGS